MSDSLLQVYIDRFVNRQDVWGRQWVSADATTSGYACQKPDMDTKGGRFNYEPVTLDLVRRHLAGQVTCAWPAVDSQLRSRWLCFDSDVIDGALDRLADALRSWKLHVIREGRRAGRDGHLWLLFDQPIAADVLIILGDAMMRLAGVADLERFPKSATGLSQVRGPLGVNLKPEAKRARSWFDGVRQDLEEQLRWLAAQPLNRAADAIREAERFRPKASPITPITRGTTGSVSSYGFPILRYVDARRVGNALVAQCPVCASEGHDRHRDNLKISLDGRRWSCFFGGPNAIHRQRAIIMHLLHNRSP